MAVEADRSGKTDKEIYQIAMDAAAATSKSYSDMLTKRRNVNNANNNENSTSPQRNNKSKKSHFGQYKKGKSNVTQNSIAVERPSYLDSHCLVVSRVEKETTKQQFVEYINKIAGKTVEFLSTPRNLAKDYAHWRTIAIELRNEDYAILSNLDIWDSKLRIKPFEGRRFWDSKASTMTAKERKSSVYQSWQV